VQQSKGPLTRPFLFCRRPANVKIPKSAEPISGGGGMGGMDF